MIAADHELIAAVVKRAELGAEFRWWLEQATTGNVVRFNLWQKHVMGKLAQSTDRRRKQAFDEAVEALVNDDGPIGKQGDYVWRASS